MLVKYKKKKFSPTLKLFKVDVRSGKKAYNVVSRKKNFFKERSAMMRTVSKISVWSSLITRFCYTPSNGWSLRRPFERQIISSTDRSQCCLTFGVLKWIVFWIFMYELIVKYIEFLKTTIKKKNSLSSYFWLWSSMCQWWWTDIIRWYHRYIRYFHRKKITAS